MVFSARVGERNFGNYIINQFKIAVMRRQKFIRLNFLPKERGLSGSFDCDHETAKQIAYALLLAASAEVGSDPITFSVNENEGRSGLA